MRAGQAGRKQRYRGGGGGPQADGLHLRLLRLHHPGAAPRPKCFPRASVYMHAQLAGKGDAGVLEASSGDRLASALASRTWCERQSAAIS